jgi:hypothetical protein
MNQEFRTRRLASRPLRASTRICPSCSRFGAQFPQLKCSLCQQRIDWSWQPDPLGAISGQAQSRLPLASVQPHVGADGPGGPALIHYPSGDRADGDGIPSQNDPRSRTPNKGGQRAIARGCRPRVQTLGCWRARPTPRAGSFVRTLERRPPAVLKRRTVNTCGI